MAHATPFALYARFSNTASLERFLFFLEEDTRPSFPDEVEPNEAPWVEHFEFLAYPWELTRLDNAVLVEFGDPHEEEDLHDDIAPMMEGAAGLGADQVLVYWSYEGEGVFERWSDGANEILWAMDDDEAEEDGVGRPDLLDEPLREQLRDVLEDAPGKALLRLAQALS